MVFKFFRGPDDFIVQKFYLLRAMPVCVCLIMLAVYYFIPANRSLTKLDWLDACIALRVVGAVLAVFLQRWHKICTILLPMGSKGRYPKKCPKSCWPIRSKETLITFTLLTFSSQCKLELTARKTPPKIIGAPKKLKKLAASPISKPVVGDLKVPSHQIRSAWKWYSWTGSHGYKNRWG